MNNEINPVDLGLVCIVLMGYIVGKVWMYYRIEDNPKTKKGTKNKVIKRGAEWPD